MMFSVSMNKTNFDGISFFHSEERTRHCSVISPVFVGNAGRKFSNNLFGFKFHHDFLIFFFGDRRREIVSAMADVLRCHWFCRKSRSADGFEDYSRAEDNDNESYENPRFFHGHAIIVPGRGLAIKT